MDRRDAIRTWWATLSPADRIDAKASVERSAMPQWMATALSERLGADVVTVWYDGDPRDHPAPYRTTDEVAALIAAQHS